MNFSISLQKRKTSIWSAIAAPYVEFNRTLFRQRCTVFEQILQRMQEKIRQQQYVMTLHAEEEMEDDHLSIGDVEQGILTGIILERQSDRSTSEWKYRICGTTLDNTDVEGIAKLGITGKVVIITVYLL